MFVIIALVISLADPNQTMTLESTKGFPSMQVCEAGLPEAKKALFEYLGMQYGVGPEQVKVEVKCEFKSQHQH